MCLSDFIAPVESGITDYIGVFAVTTGFGCSNIVQKYFNFPYSQIAHNCIHIEHSNNCNANF